MVYGYLHEGTKVKVENPFGDEFEGEITQCLYSAGLKGINSGYSYFVKRNGKMFTDECGYKNYQITKQDE